MSSSIGAVGRPHAGKPIVGRLSETSQEQTSRTAKAVSRKDWKPASATPPSRLGKTAYVRYPRLVLKDEKYAKELKQRTLTNLYAAVFAAYGWPVSLSDDELLAKLLALNLKRAGKEAS